MKQAPLLPCLQMRETNLREVKVTQPSVREGSHPGRWLQSRCSLTPRRCCLPGAQGSRPAWGPRPPSPPPAPAGLLKKGKDGEIAPSPKDRVQVSSEKRSEHTQASTPTPARSRTPSPPRHCRAVTGAIIPCWHLCPPHELREHSLFISNPRAYPRDWQPAGSQ